MPSEKQFQTDLWKMNHRDHVRGGNSRNPFAQLSKQRRYLIGELEPYLPDFHKNSIFTMVCFQHKVDIIGDIPGEFEHSFTIADSENFVNKIYDILDLHNKSRFYLSPRSKEVFLNQVFFATEYNPESALDLPDMPINRLNEPAIVDGKILNEITDFLQSESKVLTLYGTAGSGKTGLIPYIRKIGFDNGFIEIPVYSYSSRLRNNLLNHHPDLEDVESLFNTIYDLKNEQIDENYIKKIPLNTEPLDGLNGKKLYIILDSHLITNSYITSSFIQFGTGKLLDDILTYVDLEKNQHDKIIFIGDKNKLSYGSSARSALNASYLQRLLESKNIVSSVTEMEMPINETKSNIVQLSRYIAEHLKNNRFHQLNIDPDEWKIRIYNKREEKKEVLINTYNNPTTSKIVVYSNEQAKKINLWIKKHLALNGEEINAGDFIVFNNTIYAYTTSHTANTSFHFTELKKIYNGTFGKVITVDKENIIAIKDENNVELKLIPATVTLQDNTVVELLLFENYLLSDSSELDLKESVAYQKLLAKLEKEAMDKEPFEKSEEYKEMLISGDYVKKVDRNGKIIFRDRNDQRKLTKYEKQYRERIILQLRTKDGEYFKILNAAQVKYGWCMTVNKAMAFEFDEVYFDTDQGNRGRTNAEYFKWLYTGILIGKQDLSLLNWEPISPFKKTYFASNPPTNVPGKFKKYILYAKDLEKIEDELQDFLINKLEEMDGKVADIESKPYSKIVTVETQNENVRLQFYYTKHGEVNVPQLVSGSNEVFQSILTALDSNGIPDKVGKVKDTFLELQKLLKEIEIDMTFFSCKQYETIFRFTNKDGEVFVRIRNDGKGLITKFEFLQGNTEIFRQIEEKIKTTYF